MYRVLIQHDISTDRYHPAYYRWAPFPGGVEGPMRFKSCGHHTTGFEDLATAQEEARKIAIELTVLLDRNEVPVKDVDEAGADIVFESNVGR